MLRPRLGLPTMICSLRIIFLWSKYFFKLYLNRAFYLIFKSISFSFSKVLNNLVPYSFSYFIRIIFFFNILVKLKFFWIIFCVKSFFHPSFFNNWFLWIIIFTYIFYLFFTNVHICCTKQKKVDKGSIFSNFFI